jgi:hypothetical protein
VKKRHQARLNAQEKVVNHLSTITINVNIPPTALLQFVPNRGLKMWDWLKRLFGGGGGTGNTGSGG